MNHNQHHNLNGKHFVTSIIAFAIFLWSYAFASSVIPCRVADSPGPKGVGMELPCEEHLPLSIIVDPDDAHHCRALIINLKPGKLAGKTYYEGTDISGKTWYIMPRTGERKREQ